MSHSDKMVKVLYLNDQHAWEDYAQALLKLETRQEGINLLLALAHPLPPHQLAVLPLIQILREKERTICIGVEMMSQVERLQDNVIAVKLEEWNRVLGLSFRSEDYCSMILEQLQLEIASSNQLPCRPQELIKYIAKEINCVDLAFENPNIVTHFFQLVAHAPLSQDEERDAFRIIKTIFMQSRRDILQTLIRDDYFSAVLRCLSFNYEFGDRRIDYMREYERIAQCRNILELEEKNIISHYRCIMKARFLMDYPTAMFIEPNTQIVLNDIIRQHTVAIINILIEHPNFLSKYKLLALTDPVVFVQLFSELWEMFKLVSDELATIELKSKFHALFLRENLLEISFECVLKVAAEGRAQMRLYQKFLQSLNPFLSYKWGQSQECLLGFLRSKQVHLLQILLVILGLNDYNTKTVILLFARYLVQPSQNRKSMRQAFISYVFSEFVAKLDSYFATIEELEILMGFMLRCYKVDHNRTRRCITEGTLIDRLEGQCENKYALILIVRFLRSLLQGRFEELFLYLQRHRAFSFLREAYHRAKKYNPRGILYSMFLGLIKDLEKSENRRGVTYIFDILCPP